MVTCGPGVEPRPQALLGEPGDEARLVRETIKSHLQAQCSGDSLPMCLSTTFLASTPSATA